MLNQRLVADHGLTLDAFDALARAQDGKCAICRKPPRGGSPTDGRLHVDHDHRTGRIRGLLCRHCNTGIGLLGDSPDVLDAAAIYLRKV